MEAATQPCSSPRSSPRTEVLRSAVVVVGFFLLIGAALLFTMLALDIFTIPYLTPAAHSLARLLAPLVPLLFPLFLGLFLKVLARPRATWPKKTSWLLITGSWVFQHLQRATADAVALWAAGDVCGLRACRGKWVEWVLVLAVVGAQCAGLRWEAGYVDGWIDHLIAQEAEKKVKEDQDMMVRGEVPDGWDLEKADSAGFVGAVEEKTDLKHGETEEVLVVVVGEEVEKV
ncbi:hypothetical protein BUE80_DR005642 [Diplocarpon rosae]|nr:hypothetical protein BUE80_DR005642 [Diplocarpon rosae]